MSADPEFVIDRVRSWPVIGEGGRHNDILYRMGRLRGNGVGKEDAVRALAEVYPIGSGAHRKITEKELRDAYDAAADFDDKPWTSGAAYAPAHRRNEREKPKIKPCEQAGEAMELPTTLAETAPAEFLERLYGPDAFIAIGKSSWEVDGPGEGDKPPIDRYVINTVSDWRKVLERQPEKLNAKYGVWFVVNPLVDHESCKEKFVADFRYALIESDSVPLKQQYANLIKSGLPIAAIYTSAGDSVHALVRIDALSQKEYDARVQVIYDYAANLGLCQNNKNANRYSRLPGCYRDGKKQTLLSWSVGPESFQEWKASLLAEADDTEWFNHSALLTFDRYSDPDCLIGNRWICRGDSFILQGYTGFGKSSLALQLAMSWALGRDLFGVKPIRPLKIVFIQAENNCGDIAEPFQDIAKHVLNCGPDELEQLSQNLIIGRQSSKAGAQVFAAYVRQQINLHHPDMVLCDPLLSYFGKNISDTKDSSEFFRQHLQPIQNETGVVFGFVHHFGKPPKAGEQRQGPGLYHGLGSSDIFNWAREVITLTKETGTSCYKLEFGKRGRRAGIVNDLGQPVSELYIRQADGYKTYWTLDENITSAEDAQAERDQAKLERIHAFIVGHHTVTQKMLRDNAKALDIPVNNIGSLADKLVRNPIGGELPIYSWVRAIKGKPGVSPTIYSIDTEPCELGPIELPVIGQKEMDLRGKWYDET